MRSFLYIAVCTALIPGTIIAQHRGGGGGGGGARGGSHGSVGGGFARSGGYGGGYSRGGGFVSEGFRGGYNRGYGYRGYGGFSLGFYGGFYGGYYPYYSYGGYWPSYYDYSYYPDAYSYPAYQYQSAPNVTVVYPAPQQSAAPVYTERAHPVSHEYDEYGQEVRPSGSAANSPIYLIAMKDHTIQAAASYSVNGGTVTYVNLQHEEKHAALSDVDRELTMQLNRDRRVPFQLPAQ